MAPFLLSITFFVTLWIIIGTAAYQIYGNAPTTRPAVLRLRTFYRTPDVGRAGSRLLGTLALWPAFASMVFEREPWLALPFALLAAGFLFVGAACSERINRFALVSTMVVIVVQVVCIVVLYDDPDLSKRSDRVTRSVATQTR